MGSAAEGHGAEDGVVLKIMISEDTQTSGMVCEIKYRIGLRETPSHWGALLEGHGPGDGFVLKIENFEPKPQECYVR